MTRRAGEVCGCLYILYHISHITVTLDRCGPDRFFVLWYGPPVPAHRGHRTPVWPPGSSPRMLPYSGVGPCISEPQGHSSEAQRSMRPRSLEVTSAIAMRLNTAHGNSELAYASRPQAMRMEDTQKQCRRW